MDPTRIVCNFCLNYGFNLRQHNSHIIYPVIEVNLEELFRSSHTCPTCGILTKAIRHFFPEVIGFELFFRYSLYLNPESPSAARRLELRLWFFKIQCEEQTGTHLIDKWKSRTLCFYALIGTSQHTFEVLGSILIIRLGKPCPWPELIYFLVPSGSIKATAGLVVSWLQRCETTHTNHCQIPRGPLPKRVLQVLPNSTPGSCRVRLHESLPDQHRPYACLSHCWGKCFLTHGQE